MPDPDVLAQGIADDLETALEHFTTIAEKGRKDDPMKPTILNEVAGKLALDEAVVVKVVAEFALQLHRHALEYRGGNGDFIGEDLWCQVDPQAYYHLLGFLQHFANHYGWQPESATEYLQRLGLPSFSHQMEGWRLGS